MNVASARRGAPGRTLLTGARSQRWPARPGAVLDLAAIAFALLCAWFVAREPMGSGDYGQWLMTSRFVSGDDVPDYRGFAGVPPLVPTLIAGARLLFPDPVVALDVTRLALLAGLALAFYAAGTAIAGKRIVGLLAAVIAFAFTDEFRLLFAFGGLPQAASLIAFLLCVACVAMAGRRDRREPAWWALAAVAWSLGIVSHVGTLVAVTPALGLLVLVEAIVRPRPIREWVRRVAPAAVLTLPALVYWLTVLVPANRVYGENPASLGYRGPGKLWTDLNDDPFTVAVMAAGLVSIGAATLLLQNGRARRGIFICSTLLLCLVVIVSLNGMLGVATDYPRFGPLLLVPLVLALALGLQAAAEQAPHLELPGHQGTITASVLLATLLILLSPLRLRAYADEAAGYQLHDRGGLFGLASWIGENLPADGTVLASGAREGKWIEGLTGRETLFFADVRFSFRPAHWDRSAAAEALVRSTASLVNGYLFVRFPNADRVGDVFVPHGLSVGANHRGEYVDLLNVPSFGSAVLANDGVLATLEALEPVSVEHQANDDTVLLRTTWKGVRGGQPLLYTRTVWVEDGSRVLNILDEVETEAAVDGMRLQLSGRTQPALLGFVPDDAGGGLLTFGNVGEGRPQLAVHALGNDVAFSSTLGAVEARSSGRQIHLQITAETAGAPIASLALLDPESLLAAYNVQAVLLRRDPAFTARLRRMELLGFRAELEVEGYVLLVRQRGGGQEQPPAEPAPATGVAP